MNVNFWVKFAKPKLKSKHLQLKAGIWKKLYLKIVYNKIAEILADIQNKKIK